jgi:hypothetical protein
MCGRPHYQYTLLPEQDGIEELFLRVSYKDGKVDSADVGQSGTAANDYEVCTPESILRGICDLERTIAKFERTLTKASWNKK